jgi:hypothetical protein
MTRLSSVLRLCAVLLATAVPAFAQAPDAEPASQQEGLALWEDIHAVFSHPRCANCHVADDHPRWSGPHYGEPRIHGMNVQRGVDGSGFGNPGLRCGTCHGPANSPELHGPPGVPDWHLAPAEMVWWDRTSGEICRQIKDPARNGDRTLAEIAEHVRDDPLVIWGWEPGPGREPAPGSPEQTYADILAWAEADAPCPDEQDN